MKPSETSIRKLVLLVTTMLIAPSIAVAQTPASDDDSGEIVVRGRNIPQPMRQTAEVVTVLSAADLERQGDSNAALALTRLSGLSVVSGRFVYVRGLGDRYSSALLNGSPLPSPEPLRRQVPLDLFPSNILDGANVQKTFSPNYPGEFGGGIIDLRTLRRPTRPFLTAKVGTGANTESTGKSALTYYGARNDWTGIGGSKRDLPAEIAAEIAAGRRIDSTNFTAAERATLGRTLENTPFAVLQSNNAYADFEGEVTGGTTLDVGQFNLGLIGVVGYDSAIRTQDAHRVTVVAGQRESDYNTVQGNWDITVNGFGSASVGWDENEVTLSGLLVRSTQKHAQQQTGLSANAPAGISLLSQGTAWYERQLASSQLLGRHQFGELKVDWRAAFAQSQRDAPYERGLTYYISTAFPDGYFESGNPNYNHFSYLTDEVGSAGVDLSYTMPLSTDRDVKFSAGADWSNTVRWYDYYAFQFDEQFAAAITTASRVSRPDYLFQPDNITANGFVLNETTNRDDSYRSRLTVKALYGAVDIQPLQFVRVSIGGRYEDATEIVRTLNHYNQPSLVGPTALENSYFLPAGTVTWNFADNLQFRTGYSKTIARPQFRELAFSSYIDPETDRIYRGNPKLQDSEFENYDARLEYYFGTEQFVTAGGFYKKIENPIEEVIFPSAGKIISGFLNAPEAELYGAEFEYRTRFEMPFDVLPFMEGEMWRFGANYTYTHSEVKAGAGDMVASPFDPPFAPIPANQFKLDGSALQGTPENLINVSIGLETAETDVTLLVGWVDERILRRGSATVPDVIERPGVNVDLVYKKDVTFGGSTFTIGASGRNLLNEAHEEFQVSPGGGSVVGRTEFNTYERGRSFSVSLATKF